MSQATSQEFAAQVQSGIVAGVVGAPDAPVPQTLAQEALSGTPLQVDIPGRPGALVDAEPPFVGLRFKASSSANTKDLSPALVGSLNALYDIMPPEVRDTGMVQSGVRSTELQRQLHARMLAGTGGRAAAPGRSRHEAVNGGTAVDIGDSTALKWIWSPAGKAELARLGLEAPFADDRGHIQLVGSNAPPATEGKPGPNQASWQDFQKAMQEPTGERVPRPVSNTLDEIMHGAGAVGGAVTRSAAKVFTEEIPATGEDIAAFANGVRKGLMDIPLGMAQTVAPRSVMQPVEDEVQKFENHFQTLTENNPVADLGGRVVGGTLGIMAAARLLGPMVAPFTPALVTRALTAIGAGGRTALATGASSGTMFYPGGPERESRMGAESIVPGGARAVDALLGGTLGLAAKPILSGVNWAARNLSDTALARSFLQVVKSNAEDVTRNSERPLREALGHYEATETVARSKYALRNRAGEQFEGFASGVGEGVEGFKQAIDTALAASQKAGVQVRGVVQSVTRNVKDILGITQQEAALARAEAAAATAMSKVPQGLSPAAQAQVRAQMGLEVFEPELVSAGAYAEARTAINDAMKTSNTAARTQLRGLLREIDGVVRDAANAHNMPVQTFLRRADEVAKFFKDNVVPLRQFFGGRTAGEVRDSAATMRADAVTPAAFYDRLVKLVESGDKTRIETLAKTLGPTGKQQLTRLMAAEATAQLTAKGDMAAVAYVRANEDALRVLLGRSEFDNLMGASKIAETVFNRVKQEAAKEGGAVKRGVIHGWGPAFGVYELGHALVNAASGTGGVGRHLMTAGVMFTAMPALHLTRRVIGELHNNTTLAPLVRRAAHLRPGSPELDALVSTVERRLRVGAAAGVRGAAEATQATP